MTEQRKVDCRTKRAADIALAKRQISPAGYRALSEEGGRITLQQAKELGRDRGPDDTGRASRGPGRPAVRARSASAGGGRDGADTPPRPVSRISKDDRSRLCMCGCGKTTRGRFAIGHDQRLLKFAYEHLRGERELTKEQLEYVTSSGKLERARARVEREEQDNRQKAES
jgi:hypothetical protein